MRFGVLFLLLAASLALWVPRLGVAGALLLWPVASFALVGLGYLGLGPAVLGKDERGRRAPWAAALHAPFFALSLALYHLLRAVRAEDPWNEVSPGVYVGRLCGAHELPPEVGLVVDLTSELQAPVAVRARAGYRCLPTLDGLAPREAPFLRLAEEVAAFDGPVFVHCAAGHGRSATLAGAVLVRRGVVEDLLAAERHMKRARPGIRLTASQRRLARALARD